MIRLKKNKPVKYNGVYYDFTGLEQNKLKEVYDNNPSLRHFFETDEEEEYYIPKTTEFEEELAKVGILTSNVTAKRLAEINQKMDEKKRRADNDKTEEE